LRTLCIEKVYYPVWQVDNVTPSLAGAPGGFYYKFYINTVNTVMHMAIRLSLEYDEQLRY